MEAEACPLSLETSFRVLGDTGMLTRCWQDFCARWEREGCVEGHRCRWRLPQGLWGRPLPSKAEPAS